LNRVRDASPSQIHGSINAKGTVLILNQNGVLFGGASSVNVRNLVASSANITNDDFLGRGIYSISPARAIFPALPARAARSRSRPARRSRPMFRPAPRRAADMCCCWAPK
jgi:hypothetical protein